MVSLFLVLSKQYCFLTNFYIFVDSESKVYCQGDPLKIILQQIVDLTKLHLLLKKIFIAFSTPQVIIVITLKCLEGVPW